MTFRTSRASAFSYLLSAVLWLMLYLTMSAVYVILGACNARWNAQRLVTGEPAQDTLSAFGVERAVWRQLNESVMFASNSALHSHSFSELPRLPEESVIPGSSALDLRDA